MRKRCLSASFAKVVNILSQLSVTALLSRGLSGEAFGLCAIFANMVLMVGMFDGGIGGGGLRNALTTRHGKQDQKELFFSSFYFIGAIYLVLALMYGLFIQHYLHRFFALTDAHLLSQLKTIGWIFALSMVIRVPFSVYASGFYAFEEDGKKATIDILESIALVAVISLASYFKQDFLVGFGGYYFTLSLMSCLGFLWFLKERNWNSCRMSWKSIYTSVRPLFKVHRAFWIQNVLSLALFSLSPYLLMRFMGLEQVGEYTLIYRGCCLCLGIHFALLNPLWASYAKAFYEKRYPWIENTFWKSIKGTMVLFGVGAFGMVFFYQPILFLWSHKKIVCDDVVILYAIWMILYALINCISVFLNALNRVQRQCVALLIGAIANILLGVFFGGRWGASGVVLASIVALLPLLVSNMVEAFHIKKQVVGVFSSDH